MLVLLSKPKIPRTCEKETKTTVTNKNLQVHFFGKKIAILLEKQCLLKGQPGLGSDPWIFLDLFVFHLFSHHSFTKLHTPASH
jgi:hypothetical protein